MPPPSRLDQQIGTSVPGTWAYPSSSVELNRSREPGAEEDRWLRGSFAQGSRLLDYCLYIPASRDITLPMPMLVMLHGCGQDAENFALSTQMNDLARDAGVMVLYPEQVQRANAQKCWNWFKPQHQRRGRGEPELLACLVHDIATEFDADRSRIYVAGLSAGGAMAAILAQEYPEVFCAAGVHSGVLPGVAKDLNSALDAMRYGVESKRGGSRLSVPLIVFHGEADDVVHRRNGAALVEAVCEAFGLSAPVLSTGRSINCRSFTQRAFRLPDGTSLVEYWQLHGAGHAWSGGHPDGSHCAPGGPDASAEMLRFFLSHQASRGETLLN